MVGLKENLDILTHEHQMLSQELTDKQNEYLRSQRELNKAESELVQLRPLREHL
jgi:predicted nuclease with TOPRIM domain